MLFRNFEIQTSRNRNETITEIQKIMNPHIELFSKKILRGSITDMNCLKAVINPPYPMSDPFRNVVIGKLIETKKGMNIELKTRFGILNSILCFFFYIPIIFNLDSDMNWRTFGMLTILNVIIILLLYLKLRWDSNRLDRKLDEILK